MADQERIYLDNAASSHPKPQAVYEAVNHALRIGANPGRSGHGPALSAGRMILDARENVAAFIGAKDSSRVIFTHNATHALNLALFGLLEQGDHVVSSVMEHNSVLRPLNALAERGVDFTLVGADRMGFIDPSEIKRAIRPNTKLVAITHASNVSGTLTDLTAVGEICREAGVKLLLDASQTLGCIDIDVVRDKIDLLAAPGHKGLLGPQGTGILYVSSDIELKPLLFGGTGTASSSPVMPDHMPERLEAGTLNTPGIAGLNEGVTYLLERTVADVRAKEHEIIEYLLDAFNTVDGLVLYGPTQAQNRVAVFSFNLKHIDPAHLGYALDEAFGIAVRVGLHCAPKAHEALGTYPTGTVRASFGPFNTVDDAKKLIEALKTISRM